MRQILLEDRALPIFPCRSDKRPTCPHGFKDAIADPKASARLFSLYPGSLIGVPTGVVGGIDVIDIDDRNGGDRWFHQHRDRIPVTRTHQTQGGGLHLIFRHTPGLRCSNGRIAPGVDTKGDGGYIIWWPARSCRVLVDSPVADFPRWLRDGLTRPIVPTPGTEIGSRGNGPPMVEGRGQEIPKPLYFEVLRRVPLTDKLTRHHQRRVIGILSIVTTKCEYRNNALNVAAYCFRELIDAGIVSRGVAESLLLGAADVCGYIAKDGIAAATATIRSGLGSLIGGPSPFFDDVQEGAA